ncbi:MAG: ATP-binding domain-containing protein [Desulfobacterales bacterium]
MNLEAVYHSENRVEELVAVVKSGHPWSSLHYGFQRWMWSGSDTSNGFPNTFGNSCEIQILSPMIRELWDPEPEPDSGNGKSAGKGPPVLGGERIFRVGDRVIHRRNNYDLNVFNGDIGVIKRIDNQELTCTVSFFPDNRDVFYEKENIMELDLAYAITIHKSQGSEFEIVIIPVLTQHFKMLFRNLIYTGLTRAKKYAFFVGTRKALAMAVKNQDTSRRQTALKELLTGDA